MLAVVSTEVAQSSLRFFVPEIKGSEKRMTGSLNSLVQVRVNLSHLLIKALRERCEAESTGA